MEPSIYRGMKMNDVDGKDKELVGERVIRQFINDQLNELKEDKKEDNNSFVFFEKSTLNILMTYLLMNTKYRTDGEGIEGRSEGVLLKEIERVLADNKKEFEEIIKLLKEVR